MLRKETKNRFGRFTFWGVSALLVVTSLTLLKPDVGKAKGADRNLALTISVNQSSFLRAEPIPIKFTLSNNSASRLTWKGILGIGPDVNLLVKNQNGQETRWEGRKFSIGTVLALPAELGSGEQIEKQSLMSGTELLERIFPSSGRYDLKVEFVYATDVREQNSVTIESESVPIIIVEPSGREAQAYEFIKGPLVSLTKQSDIQLLAQRQQEFVNSFETSAYAKYVIFQLANTYMALGEHRKAAREVCRLTGQNFFYSKAVETKTYELEAKLRPFVPVELPDGAPEPPRPHPCTRMLN